MRIKAVETKKDMADFVRVPHVLYDNIDHYVFRPDIEMKAHFGPKNPFFNHADVRLFVAYDFHDRPSGRIAVHIDHHNKQAIATKTGHFGFLEGQDSQTIQALMKRAETHLTEKGMRRIAGPYSFSTNDESGLLVDGFEHPPRLMMNYAKPFYKDVLVDDGFEKAKDLLAYDVDATCDFPRAASYMVKQAAAMDGLSERPVRMTHFRDDLDIIMTLFNDAWSDNWGFVPMDDEEIGHMGASLRPIIVPDMARIAFVDGKPAAMIVALPDVNQALHGLDGKLFPFGFLKLLMRLKGGHINTARVLLMGTAKKYKGTALSAALSAYLVQRVQDEVLKRGYTTLEMSWILEDNAAMCRMIEMFGGRISRRYRLYEKQIGVQ